MGEKFEKISKFIVCTFTFIFVVMILDTVELGDYVTKQPEVEQFANEITEGSGAFFAEIGEKAGRSFSGFIDGTKEKMSVLAEKVRSLELFNGVGKKGDDEQNPSTEDHADVSEGDKGTSENQSGNENENDVNGNENGNENGSVNDPQAGNDVGENGKTEETLPQEESNKFVPDFAIVNKNVSGRVNIRKSPVSVNYNDTTKAFEGQGDGNLVGKIYADSYVKVLGTVIGPDGNEWTKVSTGNVKEGFIFSEYLTTGERAMEEADMAEYVELIIEDDVEFDVKEQPDGESDSIDYLFARDSKTKYAYRAILSESTRDWIKIVLDASYGTEGYVDATTAREHLNYNMQTGYTMDEHNAKMEQDEIQRMLNSKRHIRDITPTFRSPDQIEKLRELNDEDVFIMCYIVSLEADDQKYEGMLAVANVILNRWFKGNWDWGDGEKTYTITNINGSHCYTPKKDGKSTIYEVVYGPNQFETKDRNILKTRDFYPEVYAAVYDAIGGVNNIDDFSYFRMNEEERKSEYTEFEKFYIINDHVFYERVKK